ncbi:hypothetical protein D3C71_1124520 [compost metagenome]
MFRHRHFTPFRTKPVSVMVKASPGRMRCRCGFSGITPAMPSRVLAIWSAASWAVCFATVT